MYSYNPDRRGLSEVKLLQLEPWRLYPTGDELSPEFLKLHRSSVPQVTQRTRIASIGSCFSREIKKWLQSNGYAFIETAKGPCVEAGSARYDRVYNTFTLRQEFERAFGTFDPKEVCWEFEEKGELRLLDPYRKNVAWESKDEMYRELVEHRENVRKAFIQAEILIITVGQAEIWYNRIDEYVYPLVPPVQVYDPVKHGFRLTTYQENLANLERIYSLFVKHNPTGHIIVTVSPVPLRATFRPINSLIANSASKSLLRAAVETFILKFPERVTYFPAYEVVMVTEKAPFKEDNRHIKPEVIDRIMNLFEEWFVKREIDADNLKHRE